MKRNGVMAAFAARVAHASYWGATDFDFWLKVFAVSFGMGAVEMVRVSAIGENGSTPWVTEGLRASGAQRHFFLHAPAQKFALYSLLRAGSLQPMPRKPQALRRQF